jgi:hypothetical protein
MGGCGQRYSSAALPLEMTRCLLYNKLGGPPGLLWTGKENLAVTGVQSMERPARSEGCYTDCAISTDNRYSKLSF